MRCQKGMMTKLEKLNKILHKLRTSSGYVSEAEVNRDIYKAIKLVEEMRLSDEGKNPA